MPIDPQMGATFADVIIPPARAMPIEEFRKLVRDSTPHNACSKRHPAVGG